MTATRLLQYLVIANAVGLVIQSVRVIAVYASVYSLLEDKNKRQLPMHVWEMAAAFLIFVLGTTWFLIQTPMPNSLARGVIYGFAGLLGQHALWNVLKYERRQYSKVTNFHAPSE